MNLGCIDLGKLESLAVSSGITASELHQALEARNMLDIAFCTSSLGSMPTIASRAAAR